MRPTLLAACLFLSCPVAAAPVSSDPSTWTVQIDNDMFGGHGQDQGYSNGLQVDWRSAPLGGADDPWLARLAQPALRHLENQGLEATHIHAGGFHGIYTPNDYTQSGLVADDRPYAGVFLLEGGYQGYDDTRWQATTLRAGWVGRNAMGRQAQNGFHHLTGNHDFNGWDHQLKSEVILGLQHDRRWRLAHGGDRARWDLISRAGGAIGNYSTMAYVGGEARLGVSLPKDFGSTTLRDVGRGTAFQNEDTFHVFVTADGRWVGRDMTLDGNTWRDSHSVNRKAWVGRAGVGAKMARGDVAVVFARYWSTREFEGQRETPVFGSLELIVDFD